MGILYGYMVYVLVSEMGDGVRFLFWILPLIEGSCFPLSFSYLSFRMQLVLLDCIINTLKSINDKMVQLIAEIGKQNVR